MNLDHLSLPNNATSKSLFEAFAPQLSRMFSIGALIYTRTALIWSDPVNACTAVGWFLFFRGQGQQQPKQNGRRLISLIFAGRNRMLMIRRELPRTSVASPAEPVA